MWSARSNSVAQTMNLGRAVARHARAGDVIALVGDLGAGKTQFVRGLAGGMGIEPRDVASPTFVVIHEYQAPDDRPPLIHIDGYRLTGLQEIESIGWDRPAPEMLHNAVVAIEWADRLADQLGDDVLTVTLSHAGECQRDVQITPEGSWRQRMDALARTLEQLLAETPLEPQKLHPRQILMRKCPVCREPVTQENPAFPFCSARCKMIDLGRWAAEKYVISRPIERSDLEEGE